VPRRPPADDLDTRRATPGRDAGDPVVVHGSVVQGPAEGLDGAADGPEGFGCVRRVTDDGSGRAGLGRDGAGAAGLGRDGGLVDAAGRGDVTRDGHVSGNGRFPVDLDPGPPSPGANDLIGPTTALRLHGPRPRRHPKA
jgi:hypothetical protein